jgi:hypothetical protein
MNLSKELQTKLGEHDPSEVDELILDDLFEEINCFSEDNRKALEQYSNLLHLSLNGFGLTSLKNFPKIVSLQILEIRQNKLSGSDLGALKELYPELYKLKVGENPITSLDIFKPLAGTNLRKLEIGDTPVSKKGSYRDDLFTMIKSLEVVDRMTRESEEIDSTIYEDEEGEEEFDDEEDFDDEEGEEFDEDEDFDEEDNDEEESKDKKRQRRD